MTPTPVPNAFDLTDLLRWLPWVAGLALVYFWLRGLRWSRRRMSAATQAQTVVAKASRTPLQVVWSSLGGCLSFVVLLLVPILLGLLWFLVSRR